MIDKGTQARLNTEDLKEINHICIDYKKNVADVVHAAFIVAKNHNNEFIEEINKIIKDK